VDQAELILFWLAVGLGLASLCVLLAVIVWLMWSRAEPKDRTLVKRVSRLPIRDKLKLALALARDSRIPLALRAIPPGLILYLATPIDVIPDFIPVIGHLDDLVIAIIGVGILLRFTPRHVLEEQIARLESTERGT
jgi:uncharacterized membrane protein YkvA (DUF1232 family)